MHIWKDEQDYAIEKQGQEIARVKIYGNPMHNRNSYVDFDQEDLLGLEFTRIFQTIRDQEGRPLQAMLSSEEDGKAKILSTAGFEKVRRSFEMEVRPYDLLSGPPASNAHIQRASPGHPAYEAACLLLHRSYRNSHEAINPLTASLETFKNVLPDQVFYEGKGQQVDHAAFVEGDEIAYICTQDLANLEAFALALAQDLFQTYPILYFEADDVDPAAMLLKALFKDKNEESYDTWVLT